MCEKCKNESDDNYEGSSIAAMRQQAIGSIVKRHPELGLEPEDITFRFVPKYKWRCVRINLNTDTPRYEIHVREAMGPAMKGGPPLWGIALAASVETGDSYDEMCEILGTQPRTHHEALFVSENPPVNPVRIQSHNMMGKYDANITEYHSEDN